jgi:membrane-bound lytic murein transglycosylase F
LTRKAHIWFFFILTFALLSVAIGCGRGKNSSQNSPFPAPISFDLDSIVKRGKLVLLTENSASTYYLYRGQEKGYDLEVVKAFAKHLGVRLEVRILDDVDKMFELLNKGAGDIIASNLTVTPQRQKFVSFSQPVYQSRQVLVQRRFDPARPDSVLPLITDTSQIASKDVWVHKYSSFYTRLHEMGKAAQDTTFIKEAPGEISTDDLIRLTAEGQVPATVTDENLALIQGLDYPELDMNMAITGNQDIAFAVRENAPKLLQKLNAWLGQTDTQNKLKRTFRKYFGESDRIGYKGPFTLPLLGNGQISPYDSLFKKYAPEIDWDWRLLAALAYQESRFNPEAESWSGAFGIMQLMPETAIKFGCDTTQLIEPNIKAGVQYIKFLNRFWKDKINNKDERLNFVLASYNIGPGHILDARNIAQSLGRPDSLWFGHVAECLLLKTQEKFYTQENVKHGYCHASEPYEFVKKVISIYEFYKNNNAR